MFASLASAADSIGSIASGIGSVGGLFGRKGSSNKAQEAAMERQVRWQRVLNQTALQDRVMDAEKAGIHPLFAIGASLNPGGVSMPGFTENTSLGDRLGEMGQNIERAVGAREDRRQRALLEKSTLLDIERKQIENETLRNGAIASRMALQNQAGQPPASQSVYESVSNKAPLGHQGSGGLHAIAVNEHGQPIRVFNSTELGDNEMLQAMHTLRYSVPDAFHNFMNRKIKPSVKRGLKTILKSSYGRTYPR